MRRALSVFMAHVDQSHPRGCWMWTGAKNDGGYGNLRMYGRTVYAHRISYELHFGEIPPQMELDHLCRNPSCVNPSHLEPVTHKENVRRGRSECFEKTGLCMKGLHDITTPGSQEWTGANFTCAQCRKESLRLWRLRNARHGRKGTESHV